MSEPDTHPSRPIDTVAVGDLERGARYLLDSLPDLSLAARAAIIASVTERGGSLDRLDRSKQTTTVVPGQIIDISVLPSVVPVKRETV